MRFRFLVLGVLVGFGAESSGCAKGLENETGMGSSREADAAIGADGRVADVRSDGTIPERANSADASVSSDGVGTSPDGGASGETGALLVDSGPDIVAEAGGDATPPSEAGLRPDTGPTGQPDAGISVGPPDAGNPCVQVIGALTYGFEGADQGWTHEVMDGVDAPGQTVDHWQRGKATSGPGSCHGGQECWATNLMGNYVQCQRGELRSPRLDLSACAAQNLYVKFWHAYDFWSGSYEGQTYTDGAVIEISKDNGVTWMVPAGLTYPGTVHPNPRMTAVMCLKNDAFYVEGKSGFVRSSGGWKMVEIPIPASHRTNNFRVRFAYASGVSYNSLDVQESQPHARPGWYVDDLSFAVR